VTFPELPSLVTMDFDRCRFWSDNPHSRQFQKGSRFVSSTQQEIANTLIDDFSFFDDWKERYLYIIELGGGLPEFEEANKTEAHRVQGCTSNAWLFAESDSATSLITFRADSDSQIVRGLIAILLMFFSERSPAEIIDFEVTPCFHEMSLDKHLSRSRSNGLNFMIQKMKDLAANCQNTSG
jgi:cysteine desulfuration protein SufE